MQLTALRIMVTGAIIVVAVGARMQVSRSFPRQEEGPRTGGNRQGEHPLHVPRHGHEAPLASHFFRPRSRNWRNPITDLMMPNTGSGVCLRCQGCLVAGSNP